MKKSLACALAALFTGAGLTLADGPPALLVAGPGEVAAPRQGLFDFSGEGAVQGTDPADGERRAWFSAEYLLWKVRTARQPVPLVSTTPLPFLPGVVVPAASGQPGTAVALGGESLESRLRSGARFSLGGWLDCDQTFGVEAGYFFLAPRSRAQAVATSGAPGSPVLAVPVFDTAGPATFPTL